MNLQELFPRFSPSRMLSNQVLLIVGQELKQLIYGAQNETYIED